MLEVRLDGRGTGGRTLMGAPKGNQFARSNPGEGKDKHLHIRVREADWEDWKMASAFEGLTVSDWVRQTLANRAAQVHRMEGILR
jgi:uncharacterized protein (DUF1778 family)